MRKNKWSEAGYTLAELLITMAIIAILGAVSTVAAVTMIRNVRQAASDKIAESLYESISAHLQEVYAFNYEKVETLQGDNVAKGGVSAGPVKILYVSKEVGSSLGTDATKLNVVLGENGSAVGADYYSDSIIVEYNPSSLQVYSVFYSSQTSPDAYYKDDNATLSDLRNSALERRSQFNGYLGYYQANTQNLPEANDNEYGVVVGTESKYSGDTQRHLYNMDELTAPISVYIPNEEKNNGSLNKLQFEITVTGRDSKAEAKITYKEETGKILTTYAQNYLKNSNLPEFPDHQVTSFQVILDNLDKKGLQKKDFNDLFCVSGDKETTLRFYGLTTGDDPQPITKEVKASVELIPKDGKLFTPGEDIEVTVSAISAADGDRDISVLSKNSAVDNSLFAYGSAKKSDDGGFYAAYLEYGRHLQNLHKDISGITHDKKIRAYQVADIDFTKEGDHLWASIYSDASKVNPYDAIMPFTPIENSKVEALEGDYKLNYNGGTDPDKHPINATSNHAAGYVGTTDYYINGMIIRNVTDAGMFKSFGNGEIKNISLRNPRISGNGVTGGFIAKASLKYDQNLNIENCALYMTDEYCESSESSEYGIVEDKTGSNDEDIQDDSDAKSVWMSGKKYAGGLVGEYTHSSSDTSNQKPQLTILNSHASTVINTTDGSGASGGLIGMVGGEGSIKTVAVSIERSYADSYIYGADTGGLIGRIANSNAAEMKYVYTAGFQMGKYQAGFANGTVTSIDSSYSFVQMTLNSTSYAATTATKIDHTNDGKVYYFPQVKANSGNVGNVTNDIKSKSVDELPSSSITETMGERLLKALGAPFVASEARYTMPYNLREGMALTTYSKPRLTGMNHYGDWEEDFMPGALCYYEKYKKADSKVRFYGGNYNALYDNLADGEAVQGDGYGLVFKKNDASSPIPDSVTVRYYFAGTGSTPVEEKINLKTTTDYLETVYDDKNYIIYKFAEKNVNYPLDTDSSFYTKVEVDYEVDGSVASTDVFYFNPHFARAVGYLGRKDAGTELNVPKLKTNGVIYVRSARHLYDMSLYYKYYKASTENCIYRQTYDISYKDYDWHGYFNEKIPEGNIIVRQNPIGLTSDDSGCFSATYNGGCYKIRDISFALEKGIVTGVKKAYYTGLFGYNTGELKNIVLFSDYDDYDSSKVTVNTITDNSQNHFCVSKDAKVYYYAGTDEDITKNCELHLGILTGMNTGTITNCAVAGYCMADSRGTIIGNTNGYIYAGGITGENSGTISNSASDTPQIRVTTNYTTVYIGGFTGRNTGIISNSYSLGHIDVVNPRGASIVLGGFTARNSGEITSSYAAENIQASGNSTVYAFSPQGGSVRNCNYLSNGTFSYVGHLYSYTYPSDTGTGTPKYRDDLIREAESTTKVKDGYTEDYPVYKEKNPDDPNYPFRAVVTDKDGQYKHYGDWQRNPGMGEYGIFYWEKEEGQGNTGYHFSYVGVDAHSDIAGTTLCNAHDDKGIIVDYGYGYYVKTGNESTVTTSSVTGLNIPGSYLTDVAGKLHEEVPNYTFYPYRTLPVNATGIDGYLYLNYSAAEESVKDNSDYTNGKWVLTKDGKDTTFYVAPFFANAMSVEKPAGNDSAPEVLSQDGINKTNYEVKPGGEKNPYEIRTVEQLQYINWNAATKNVSTMISANEVANETYKAFPYLAYTSELGQGRQTKVAAGHNEVLEFRQTHDVSGDKADGTPVIPNYTPIAASHTASTLSSYTAVLYTWFDSNYNGQSYKITNINISSPAFSVGVFGVTVSAGLKNIILYSDKDCVIERRNGTDTTMGGYSIGGLVGIAYKYRDAAVGTGTIENCAVSGYKIKDQSTNQQTRGESNVGGLVGATKVNLKNCSAVTDIEINCTHTHTNDATNSNGHSSWGDYVRTGGLAGALPGTAINCYSGGTITVGDDTLAESRDNSGNVISSSDDTAVCQRKYSMNVYIGGIAGSAFSMNYYNFTGKPQPEDNDPSNTRTIKNCYSYVKFPAMTGSIRSITMIASLADRYCTDETNNTRFIIDNCYYMGKDIDVTNAAKYRLKADNMQPGEKSPHELLTDPNPFDYSAGNSSNETFYNNMVRGGGAYVAKLFNYTSPFVARQAMDANIHPTSISYEQLKGNGSVNTYDDIKAALNSTGEGTFELVTTTQPNGANIGGKYSFPGNNPSLDGLDYPFPTIVTQRDIVFNRDVNVHYGEWPLSGMYWSEARAEMDIFGDQAADDGYAYKTLELLDVGDVTLTPASFGMEAGGIVTVDELAKVGNTYRVKFKALSTGTETVTVGTAKLVLEVKANFSVSTDPTSVTVAKGASQLLDLKANAISTETGTPVPLSDKAIWTVTIRDNGSEAVGHILGASNPYQNPYAVGTTQSTIVGDNPGKTQIIVQAKLYYNNVKYESSVYLPLQTYGVIGLSNYDLGTFISTEPNGFRVETSRAAEGVHAAGAAASDPAPVMRDDGTADLYIYESYADGTLGKALITGITINGEAASSVQDDGNHKTYSAGGYTIDIGSAAENMSSDGTFRYRSLKLRPASGTGGDVSVTITLKDGETDASYTLTGTIASAHVVTAHANDEGLAGKAVLPWTFMRATGGNVDLSGDDKKPTLPGYTFDGWATSSAGEVEYCDHNDPPLKPNSISSPSSDVDLYAKWSENQYTIKFRPGDGIKLKEGQAHFPDEGPKAYTAEITLPDRTQVEAKYERDTSTMPNFVGWNTASDGSGYEFKPGETVSKLAETGEITLFAIWRDYYKVTFIDYKDGSATPVINTQNATGDVYALQPADIPISTEETRSGVLGYYWTSPATGTVYRFAGWDTDRSKAPGEVTYPVSLPSAGNPSFPTAVTGIVEDMVLYAIWEPQNYTINLVDTLQGTNASYSGLGGGLNKLADVSGYSKPDKTGYEFVGWYSDRIANGGVQIADANGILTDTLGNLLSTTNTNSITLYARYSEEVYIRLTDTNLTDGKDYLISITENGSSVGADSGTFAYLLRNNTEQSEFYSGNKYDMAGIEHAFNNAAGKFYYPDTGISLGDEVYYMDEVSMPDRNNAVRTTNPINKLIPSTVIWRWEDPDKDGVGTFRLSGDTDADPTNDYLFVDGTSKKLMKGSTAGRWSYVKEKKGNNTYFVLKHIDDPIRYLHSNYWSINLINEVPNNGKSTIVTIYEKTTVYLDQAP